MSNLLLWFLIPRFVSGMLASCSASTFLYSSGSVWRSCWNHATTFLSGVEDTMFLWRLEQVRHRSFKVWLFAASSLLIGFRQFLGDSENHDYLTVNFERKIITKTL